jgi:hypothetical protein
MKRLQDTWRVRQPFGDVEIELHPAPIDGAVRDASVRELRRMVSDFKYCEPQARRVLLEVYAKMRGLSASTARSDASELDASSPRADAIGQEILAAAHAGIIIARRREMRSVVVQLDTPSQAVLGPDSTTKHVYTVLVVDDTGAPVAGAKLTVEIAGDKQDMTTDGYSDSNTTLGPLASSGVETPTAIDDQSGHFILHPDYGTPNSGGELNGRQAHVNHLHFRVVPTRYPSARTT